MRNFVRVIAVLVVLTMGMGLFVVGCGTENSTSKDVSKEVSTAAEKTAEVPAAKQELVNITYTQYTAGGDTQKYLDAMKDMFNNKNEFIKVTTETVPFGEYFTQMATRIAGGNAPEIFEINFENFYTYAKRGSLRDVLPLVAQTGFDVSTLNKNAVDAFNYDGKQYGIPESFGNIFLVYNKDLFDKAGVAYPTKDWKWEDELKAAEKIRALGKDIYGVMQPVAINEFYKVVQQNGGNMLSDDGTKFTVNRPENVVALQFMVDKFVKSNVSPTQKQLAGTGDWDLFMAGKLGMLVTGPWCFSSFSANCKFSWDIAIEPGNTKKATHFFADALVLPKDGKNEAQAFEWVKFMSSSKEAAKIRIDGGWNIPVITDKDVLKAYLDARPPENRQVIFDSLEYLVTPPMVPNFGEVQSILDVHLEAARDGAKTAQQALDDAQKELEAKVKLN